jgi:hypothetical protein
MKMILAAIATLAALTSAQADRIKLERPCWNKCPATPSLSRPSQPATMIDENGNTFLVDRNATINTTLDAIARDAQRRNNAARAYQSTTTSVDGDGKITGTTTTTTFPPYRR